MKTFVCIRCKQEKSKNHFLSNNATRRVKQRKVCDACTKYREQRYASLVSNGICVKCENATAKQNRRMCALCLTAEKAKHKLERAQALKYNKCTVCLTEDAIIGGVRCQRCKNKRKISLTQRILRTAKSRAKKLNLPFTISLADIIVPERCPILNIELAENEFRAKDNSYSLDRIIPEKGYIPGNVQIISQRANLLKSNASIEELEKVVAFLRSIK